MRQFQLHDTMPFPAQRIFECAAYDLSCFARVLPDVEAIVPQKCERADQRSLRRLDVWHASGDGHALYRLLDLSAASWELDSHWQFDAREMNWSVQVLRPAKALSAHGSIRLAAAGPEQTDVEMHGELAFHAGSLGRGIALAGAALGPLIEQTLLQHVERNLAALLGGIEAKLSLQDSRGQRCSAAHELCPNYQGNVAQLAPA